MQGTSFRRTINTNTKKVLASVGCLVLALYLFGCQDSPKIGTAPTTPNGTIANASQNTAQTPTREAFNGELALEGIKKQCSFGPRYLGSEGHEKCKDYLVSEMKKYANEVILQEFTYRRLPLTNVIGVFYPKGSDKPSANPILLTAHWDTRPIADGPFSADTKKGVKFRYGISGWNPLSPILGANDGASGGAVLLELARVFKKSPPPVGVIIFLNDGEDYGDFQANNSRGEGVFLGSRYFAKNYTKHKSLGTPKYGILLDMVGATNAVFLKEAASQHYAPAVNDRVFAIGQQLGHEALFAKEGMQEVGDDHIPLNEAGIPTIDIIHPLPFGEFEKIGYTYWHTKEDTPDKCSPKVLKAVGDTIAEVIFREAP